MLDAAALRKMVDCGRITGGVLPGPLAFDDAVSAESAKGESAAGARDKGEKP
jgi:phosphate acetyltransferase/phosphate butyryltransferase